MCITKVFLDETKMKSSSITASTISFHVAKDAHAASIPGGVCGFLSHTGDQYNCWRKINWGSEYPVIVDLNKVSDGDVWLSVTGKSTWWSSVPMGRGNAISEGFTSVGSNKGLFSLGRESWSLKELSSVMGSGEVSQPAKKNMFIIFSCINFCKGERIWFFNSGKLKIVCTLTDIGSS